MKQRTRERRRRRRKRQMMQAALCLAVCVAGITLMAAVWHVTSFALRRMPGEKEPDQEEMSADPATDRLQETFREQDASSTTQKEDILLVNKTHPLPENYTPSLKRMNDYGADVDEQAYDALNAMLKAGNKEGLSFWIASSYRSMERQRELLDEDIEALVHQGYSYSQAYEEVVRETMPVGCSEHATGLAVDIVSKDYQILDEQQGRTDEIIWLQKNCSQYGFILRYPEGKEDITKVSYESWHFRYVGVEAAEEIMSLGITLEEYLDSAE